MFGTEDKWGIENTQINGPDSILRNFQKGKNSKRIWKGTKEQAEEMCALLNRDRSVAKKALEEPLSQTQKVYYMNRGKSRVRAKLPNMSAFKRCHCGAMYKGDSHCG